MENSAKALYIAGSLLIALAVISMLVAAFNNMGAVQETKDDIQSQEALIAFNREYEAFNKRIMYGVDVISCINKAISNNEQFAKNGKWAASDISDDEAAIQVEVLLKEPLKESMQIYYVNDKNKETKLYNISVEVLLEEFNEPFDEFFKFDSTNLLTSMDDSKSKKNVSEFFKENGPSTFWEGSINMEKVSAKNYASEFADGSKMYVMQLLDKSPSKKTQVQYAEGDKSLVELVKYSNNLEIVKTNESTNEKVWSSVKWTTVLADFKKRKFSCVDFHYNDNTGRIESIIFKEK